MKYFSTFSGIGGFELGIRQAFLNKSWGETEGECVGYSEVDKYAIQIYERYLKHKNYGNITRISTDTLPDFDLLCGGFPCQAFSIAGKRGGFDDTRGTLFFELARIARAKRPRYLFFENVKGLLSHDGGRTFDTIIRAIDELGYDCQWQVLNSKDFGVPQNRERVFIVGHLRGTSRPKVFPIGQSGEEVNELQGQQNVANTILARYEAGGAGTYVAEHQQHAQIGTYRTHNSGKGFRGTQSGLAPTIPSRAREDGSGQAVVMFTERRTQEAKELRRQSMKEGKDWSPRRGKELVPREDNKANTLTGEQSKEHLLSDGMRIRRLTPVECERLQGFPDNWTDCVSDTQRYKCLGNAVTVNVIQAIMEKLLA